MEILEAYDLAGTLRGAAQLVGCDHKTVAQWVRQRELGLVPKMERKRPAMEADFHLAGQVLVRWRRARSSEARRATSRTARAARGSALASAVGCSPPPRSLTPPRRPRSQTRGAVLREGAALPRLSDSSCGTGRSCTEIVAAQHEKRQPAVAPGNSVSRNASLASWSWRASLASRRMNNRHDLVWLPQNLSLGLEAS